MKLKSTLKRLSAVILLSSALSTMPTTALANTEYVQGTALSDRVYYQIGGGSAVMPPPSRQRPNELSLGLGWKANLMCGNFDMKTTVKNQLNGITEGFKDLYSNVIASATGAVASLPAMIIQRANPQLYDMLTNGLYQAKLDFDSLKTNCEEMSNKLADFAMDSKWAKMAGLESYKEITATETDAKTAKKKAEKDNGEKGIAWVGGEKRGGQGQKAIDVIADVVGAGYNMALGRGVTEKNAVVKCDGSLCTTWKSPAEAAEYGRRVLGSKTLSTCTTCGTPPKEQAGTGLAPEIEKSTNEKSAKLEAVLNTDKPTATQLNELSTSTVGITRGLIEALKEDADAPILGARLSQELAISQELEKALMLRRMLLTGMKEPNVSNNEAAQADLEKSLKLLDREIEQVKLEMDLQKSISNNTAVAILNSRITEQNRSLDSNAEDSANRRLANLSKNREANDVDRSQGGLTGFPGKLADNYIVIPKSEGTGIDNIYGSFAAGTSTPSSSTSSSAGSYAPIGAISGTAMEQAQGLLRKFEGFIPYAKYDVNAFRTGYGSDTVTRVDGTVVKVTENTKVTREDAERDLARRAQIFANQAKREISATSWDKLTPNAQAALTSYIYNYGTLTRTDSVIKAAQISAESGDMTALANAIRSRQTDNKGINAKRRNQEADYILKGK